MLTTALQGARGRWEAEARPPHLPSSPGAGGRFSAAPRGTTACFRNGEAINGTNCEVGWHSPDSAGPAASDTPATTMLLELALAVGYDVADQRWRAAAACAGADPETFLPHRGRSHEEALAYCRRCEVRTECLQAAFELGQRAIGVWGGTSARERRAARRRGIGAHELLAELDRR
jgi:WhiB family transcriptional regulator, redox-sensing transcriptional regulator